MGYIKKFVPLDSHRRPNHKRCARSYTSCIAASESSGSRITQSWAKHPPDETIAPGSQRLWCRDVRNLDNSLVFWSKRKHSKTRD